MLIKKKKKKIFFCINYNTNFGPTPDPDPWSDSVSHSHIVLKGNYNNFQMWFLIVVISSSCAISKNFDDRTLLSWAPVLRFSIFYEFFFHQVPKKKLFFLF